VRRYYAVISQLIRRLRGTIGPYRIGATRRTAFRVSICKERGKRKAEWQIRWKMEREREISAASRSLLAYPGLPTIVTGIFARLSE